MEGCLILNSESLVQIARGYIKEVTLEYVVTGEKKEYSFKEVIEKQLNNERQRGNVAAWFCYNNVDELVEVKLFAALGLKDFYKPEKDEFDHIKFETIATNSDFVDKVLCLVPDIQIWVDEELAVKLEKKISKEAEEFKKMSKRELEQNERKYYAEIALKKIQEERDMDKTIVAEVVENKEVLEVTNNEKTQEDVGSENLNEENDKKSWKGLSDILETDLKVNLCERDGYIVTMQKLVVGETKRSEGCHIYLTNAKTGLPCIGNSNELVISKQRLQEASEHTVLGGIKSFDISITEDDVKLAYERAKEFLEKTKNSTVTNYSKDIVEAYVDLVKHAKGMAVLETAATNMELDKRGYLCECDKDGVEYVLIKDNQMQIALDAIDAGYTRIKFCKKIRMLETHLGKEILISNRSKGIGYSFNKTADLRFYKLRVLPELLGLKDGVADREEE